MVAGGLQSHDGFPTVVNAVLFLDYAEPANAQSTNGGQSEGVRPERSQAECNENSSEDRNQGGENYERRQEGQILQREG